MQNSRATNDKYAVVKRNNPKITKPIKMLAWTNQKTILLNDDGEMRIFKKFTDPHIIYSLKDPYKSYDNILGMHPTDSIVLFSLKEANHVGIMNIHYFDGFQLKDFDQILSVAYEPKCLTIVDKNGIHIYYVAQGFVKLNVFKVGYIKVVLPIISNSVSPFTRNVITKQLFGMLYMLKLSKEPEAKRFKYTLKLFNITKFYKGYSCKASFTLKSPICDIVPLHCRGLLAILTLDSDLFILHMETQTLISDPNGISNLKPYKVLNISATNKLVIFENRRIAVVDITNEWKVVYESKADQETGYCMVGETAVVNEECIIFNDGSKFCELKKLSE